MENKQLTQYLIHLAWLQSLILLPVFQKENTLFAPQLSDELNALF